MSDEQMAITVNLSETTGQFGELLGHLQTEEEIFLAREGVPNARITPISPPSKTPRIPGQDKGRITIAPDFNEPVIW
jgi:antitoxin (DNA-binding transcriptional repressor) of toxin-antitoxin stability system